MQSRLNLKSVIAVATGVAVLYLVGVVLELQTGWIGALYCLAVGAAVWMAIRILKDPFYTNRTFDDYFYLDRPDIRRVGRE